MTRLLLAPLAGLALAVAGCAAPPPRPGPTPAALVEDVAAAEAALEAERDALRARPVDAAALVGMVRLGMWAEAEAALAGRASWGADARAAEAELRLRQHRYPEVAALVGAILRADPRHRAARLLAARLEVQAWRLPAAAAAADALLAERPRDEEAALLLGRVRLLERRYDDALVWARRVAEWNPRSAGAPLLEADVLFWREDPAGAEAPLRRALELDPWNADARFALGYAIWRRLDPAQLGAMTGQWRLALAADPLHYVTHWHLGNGHTDQSYADRVLPSDTVARARLAAADAALAAGRVAEALALARAAERDLPESVLPAMLRGSAWYLAWDQPRAARLDSAEAAFREVLRRRPGYGPAHNALAATIKQRQFAALAAFDSLEAEIAAVPLEPDAALAAVFPDARRYPGDRVERMIRMELGSSRAYLPLIQRQDRTYRVPPLHQELAQAMGEPYFRTATTFDNRQWMDIRGVGSGAAGIEYVERGAHQERNVLLHEFVHLFHGIVFTDAEVRRVRALYHDAMRDGRTLDYYAANNESEFLAQAYPAYFSPAKVHPLNHKSMNTAADLRGRDPATYAWIDSLVVRQRAALAGDPTVLRSNWAQVYVNLAEAEGADAAALLDSALVHDPGYLPAMLAQAARHREEGRWEAAEGWLARAEAADPEYAPTLRARAELAGARARAEGTEREMVGRRADLLRVALRLERDLSERASLARDLRRLLLDHGRPAEAIAEAAAYLRDAPTVSTYLRDRRDEAESDALAWRAAAGYGGEAAPRLADLVAAAPQRPELRARLAAALLGAGRAGEAAFALEDGQRILRAAGTPSPELAALLWEAQLALGDSAAARAAVEAGLRGDGGGARWIRALAAAGFATEASVRLEKVPAPRSPRERADAAWARAAILAARGDAEYAERELRAALADDPYHLAARRELIDLLRAAGRPAQADALIAAAAALPLPLGPDLLRPR